MLSTTALTHSGRRLCDYLAIKSDKLPEQLVSSGKILVCGSGHTLWDDVRECGFVPAKWQQNFDVMAVNRSVMDLPCAIKCAYSNHIDMLEKWTQARDVAYTQKDRKCGTHIPLYSNREHRNYTVCPVPGSGTSTLNAAMVALMLGYDEVYICGAPMDNGPHYYDAPFFVWNHFSGSKFDGDVQEYGVIEACNRSGLLRPWYKFLQRFKDCVTPMSGNPKLIYNAL